jgi:hypothetical protein
LSVQVAAGNTESLSFANHVCRFDSLNYRPGRRFRSRPLHRAQPPFDVAVIGFDPVIAIALGSLTIAPRDAPLGLEFPKRRWIAPQAIPGEYLRRPVVRVGQCLFQEQLGGFAITLSER